MSYKRDSVNEPDGPVDLFDVICRLDDLVDWLREHWPTEAEHIARASNMLKGSIELRLPGRPED